MGGEEAEEYYSYEEYSYEEYSYEEHGFADYEPTTVDPGLGKVMMGTAGIFLFLVLVVAIFLLCRRRRKRRKAKKEALCAALQEEEETSLFIGENIEAYFGRRIEKFRLRSLKRVASNLNPAFTERKPKSAKTMEDALGEDLFENGGVLDQLQISFGYNASLNIDESDENQTKAASQNSNKSSEAVLRKTLGKKKKKSATDALLEYETQPSMCECTKSLAAYDRETKKLLKLAIPYSISSLLSSIFDLLTLAAIGQLLGTQNLSAYILVYYAFTVGSMFIEGLLASITPVCSQAIGAEHYVLAGQYVQISVFLSVLLHVPQIVLWWFYLDNVMLWMEFDEDTAEIANMYAKVYSFISLVAIFRSALFNLLDVSGKERFSAMGEVLHGLSSFVCTAILAMRLPNDNKLTLALIGAGCLALNFIILTIQWLYIWYKAWLKAFIPGIFSVFAASNVEAVKSFLKTAIPLSLGHILSFSEWEIIFIMAGTLGPAEVAAWGIVGEIWGALESLTFAWGDAAEVRCATLLGSGYPERAEASSFKSLLMGGFGALTISAVLFGLHDILPRFITSDVTLEQMVSEVLPLVALGNVALAVGSISWQLIGAQGRYSLATAVQLVGSWMITLPLALVSSLYLGWNLTGLVAAVIIGYMVSGMLNFIILCCTKWEKRSKKIMAKILESSEAFADTDSSDSESDSDSDGDGDSESADEEEDVPRSTTLEREMSLIEEGIEQEYNPETVLETSNTSPSEQKSTNAQRLTKASRNKNSWLSVFNKGARMQNAKIPKLKLVRSKSNDKLDDMLQVNAADP